MILEATVASASGSASFNKEIAPIVFEHCAGCHRPGESGPFSLLNYNDVRKHAKQIAEVTKRGYMPPWLPAGQKDEFLGDRRLSAEQISLFTRWYESGAPEGAPGELPPLPRWTQGWQLGKPDLIVEMPRKFTLPAEGRDIYRNFVIPVPLQKARYIRAVEFRPDNLQIVHHAFIKVDASGQVRNLDDGDGEPGFPGMNLPDSVQMPSGYFLSYQPGKTPSAEPPGYGWTLKPGQDLVVQAHLRPTGKPETLQAQIGLFFTDAPPTNTTVILALSSLNIDIPASNSDWLLEDSFVLPVDAAVLSVLPHAHYLGKRLEGLARLPDGAQRQLLSIPDWDFNWQGDYRYTQPQLLPAGTQLKMRFTYDNSTNNPRNPNQPPKEVLYGPQTLDEMGELWFQVRLASEKDATRLQAAYNEKNRQMIASYAEFRLARNPHDARARTELGFTQWVAGKPSEAMDSFRLASADDPAYDQPHYYRGVLYRTQHHLTAARTEFETAIRLNPKNSRAFGNLAFVFMDLGDLDRAEKSIREAVRLDPTDALARETLDKILQLRKSPSAAAN
jgi:tetratricopeptide (TPR) repeat protein